MEPYIKYLLLSVTVMEGVHLFGAAGSLPATDNDQSRYDSDMVEGDISGIDKGQMPAQAAANAVNNNNLMWPNNTIPYDFSTQRFSSLGVSERKMVEEAMQLIALHTGQCVHFVPRTTEEDYVRFQKGMQSYSNIGRTGGKQPISLSSGCLLRYGCIQHEIMHTLGFYHEQSRTDRDQYVIINLDNIAKSDQMQFEKHSAGLTYNLPYDYESVMHYEFNAFAKDPFLPTILPKSGRPKLGQQEDLSPLDVVRIHRHLKCSIPSGKAFLEMVRPRGQQPDPSRNGSCKENHDNGKAVMLESFPAFQISKVTQEQCETYLSGTSFSTGRNCQLEDIVSSDECPKIRNGTKLEVFCDAKANAHDFRQMADSLSTPPVRAFRLSLDYGNNVTFDDLAVVRKQIVQFRWWCYEMRAPNATTQLSSLRFSSLFEVRFFDCFDLYIKKTDFWPMNKLKIIFFSGSTIQHLQKDTFTDLPALRVLALDYYNIMNPFPENIRSYLMSLHCGCEFVWLRRWLRVNSHVLRAAENENEIYALGNSWGSPVLPKNEIYKPIDCAAFPDGTSSIHYQQESFSINVPECVS